MEKNERIIALLKAKVDGMNMVLTAFSEDSLDDARMRGVIFAYKKVIEYMEDEKKLNHDCKIYEIEEGE